MVAIRTFFASAAAVAAVLAAAAAPHAQLRVDVTRGSVEPLPIALPTFVERAPMGDAYGRLIADVVSGDLERSGLFRPIDRRAFIQKPASLAAQPRFGDWRQIGAQAVLSGVVKPKPGDEPQIEIEIRLWDVFGGAQMSGLRYTTRPDSWRRVAHIIADEVYKRVTGEDGYFDTRIVYIAESGPPSARVKRLAIMDQDGANHRFLTDGRDLVLTPRFSPAAHQITYLSYVAGRPRAYVYDIDTRRQEVIGDFPGMTFAPRFSPDGDKVIMSMARDGNSEIYTMDLRTRQTARLTRHPAIDTSASYSPDGGRIVFNSDRGGSQQLYVMNADGGNPQRISFRQRASYATPVWSPRGDLIAFTRLAGGTFAIGVMKPDGSGERILVEDFLVEGPTWAPNGRVLMFFRQSRHNRIPRLFTIDLTGHNEREIFTPDGGSDPAWSPLVR